MGKRKKTPVKRPPFKAPVKLRTLQRGHDGSFQTRMEIAVLAQRGFPPSHIVKALGVSFDMAQRWSDRSEEVMQEVSNHNEMAKLDPSPFFSTPTTKKKLYKKLKRSTQIKLAKDLGVGRNEFTTNTHE